MPLVVHPSSTCDVCLESYATENDAHPHAIPCGHIFCRVCLVTVEPTNCPLCRKAFNRERIKKLHVDRPELDMESDLLQRVALNFDALPPTKAQLSIDLGAWLAGRPEDDHIALRKAWAAFQVYDTLSERKAHDKQKIKRFERMLAQRNEENEYDRDTFKAVESSLLAQVSQLTAQIADLEAQVNPLRLELAKFQHSQKYLSNPLPAPPEPIPLERFPAFARATAESAEGYAAYFTPNAIPSHFSNDVARDPVQPRADKGKGKQPQPVYGVYQPVIPGNVIIPGATPSQRVIPTESVNGHAYHTHAPASAYVDGYASGFGQGYGAATAGGEVDINHASTSAYQLPPHARADESEISLENALGSLQVWGAPAASAAIAPVAVRLSESAPASAHLQRRHPRHIASSHSTTDDDASMSSQPTTSSSRPSALRRSTVQVDGHLGESSGWPPIYAPPAPPVQSDAMVRFARDDGQIVANDAIARRAAHERHRQNRQSYSSWGTVHTNAAEDSPTNTRGSMGDLGDLVTFGPVASHRNSTTSDEILDRSLSNTPRQEGSRMPLGFRETAPVHPGHAHSHSVSSLEMVPASLAQDLNPLQRTQRTAPRRFSQLPVGTPEFAASPESTRAAERPPIDNALGLELGAEATQTPTITAPTPRVQMHHYVRSWSLGTTH